MRRDVAPDFRKIITIVPDDVLEDMRRDFQNSKHSGKEAVKKIILALSVELSAGNGAAGSAGKGQVQRYEDRQYKDFSVLRGSSPEAGEDGT